MEILFTCVLALSVELVTSQLVDTRMPLVYEDPQKLTASRPTYFGYSVLLYSRKNYTWLQVGAPRSNCEALSKIKEPGVVYRCGIAEPCQLLLLDRTGNDRNNEYWDKKDGSWLGGTMAVHSSADKMVICAPRWINQVHEMRIKDYLILGACYVGKASDRELLGAMADKLVPLLDHRNYTETTWGNKYVYDYGMGQAGMSAYFTHNTHGPAAEGSKSQQVQLVLGAPGIFNWRGSSVLYTDHSLPSAVNKRDAAFDFTDEGSFDSGVIPFFRNVKGTRDGDYMGYSGTSGHFFSPDEQLHVTGGPRGHDYMGMVKVYEFPYLTRYKPIIRQSLFGNVVGGYFGAAVAAADVTGDGLDDLLVGAPYGPQPRVHIFLGNKRGSLIMPPSGAAYLVLPQWGRSSRFGISIATADINKDGYSDVLVGAPEAEGCGGIAIFLGGVNGAQGSSHQHLLAEEVAPGLGIRGFGISIAPPVDIDGNSYPDVAVGAYLSGHAVVLRTRARASLETKLLPQSRLLRDSTTLIVVACLLYTHKHPASPSINVSRVISVDAEFGRAHLSGNMPSSFLYNNSVTLTVGREHCQKLEFLLKKDIQNFLDPVEITLNATIQETYIPHNIILVSGSRVDGNDGFDRLVPVIEGDKGTTRINLPFSTNCGFDNICSSDLVVDAYFPNHTKNGFVLGSAGSIVFEISVQNMGEPAYLAQVRVTLMSPASLARLPAVCRAEPDIICNIDNPLLMNSTKKLRLEIDMRGVSQTSRAGDHLEFLVQAITKSDDVNMGNNNIVISLPLKVDARVAVAGKSLQDTYSYTLSDNGTSELVHFKQFYEVQKFGASPVEEVKLVVVIPYKYKLDDKEFIFAQIYQPEGSQSGQPFSCIQKDNLTYAQDVSIEDTLHDEILSNYETENATRTKRSIRIRSKQNYFKPLIQSADNYVDLRRFNQMRVRREVERHEVIKLPANRTIRLSCEDPNVICHELECIIGPFRRPQHVARLLLTMALNISVIKGTLMGRKDILVYSSNSSAAIRGPDGEGSWSTEAIEAIFVSASPAAQVEAWIIALSVILGMLLLLIVAMGLVKAGFFERKKKEELQALKQAEAEGNEQATEGEDVWTEENPKEEEIEFRLDER